MSAMLSLAIVAVLGCVIVLVSVARIVRLERRPTPSTTWLVDTHGERIEPFDGGDSVLHVS